MADPEAGDLIRGGGGLRKVRVPGSGQGKRGGLRLIYYIKRRGETMCLVFLYAKRERADLTPLEIRELRAPLED